ncbi:hypothetical protein, partial [Streptomyces sp. NPDC059009]|uniref:hypothetical protein n=1 Tax=Streptomyces sp. NPDC059009 TaxID=3346694 RepID=UPI0036C321C3
AFARWRLMALHNIDSPEQAMWVRQTLLIRKAELKAEHGGSWSDVPKHIRLGMRTTVLAEGERRFRTSEQTPGRYSALAAELAQPAAPVPAQRTDSPQLDSAKAPRPQLENHDEQTSLPPGSTTASVPEGDVPEPMTTPTMTGAVIPCVETRSEREDREDLEAQNLSEANYKRTVELVYAAVESGRPVTPPDIARQHEVVLRTVQRHFKRMEREGLLPEGVLSQS